MNTVEKKPKGVKLWKKQKAQKQGSENANLKVKLSVDDEVSFTKSEMNQDTSLKLPKKRKHDRSINGEDSIDMNSNESSKNQSFQGGKKKKVENETLQNSASVKSILKKRQSESNDSNQKKKVKVEGLTNKERKLLHLNKKKKVKESNNVNDSAAKIDEAMKKGNLTKKEWKELKKQKKKLKMEKKGKGEHFELTQTLKNLWEDLRREDCKPEKKSQLLKQACDLLKGRVKEFTFAHDTVRVLECILSEGAETHRTLLFEELKNDIIPLSMSKYGKFFVQKLLKYGSKQQKEHVMKAFHGKVVKLIRHTVAADVVELAFNECANAAQRFELVQEFYGPTFKFFKTNEVSSLSELLEKDPSQKPSIIKHMKEELTKVLDKSVIKHSIVHHILWQFMIHADPASKSEIIELLRFPPGKFLLQKDGSRFGNLLWVFGMAL
ncbi:Pumilio like protein [Argiope bruennichi]|uniref:Pumilio like protein n=1 Tax=Argiope bruennichi TaxID=94029 RepID=A0A8T0EQF9_ARGBR|nr:Pumilio like protein [Argiope bruennichi]